MNGDRQPPEPGPGVSVEREEEQIQRILVELNQTPPVDGEIVIYPEDCIAMIESVHTGNAALEETGIIVMAGDAEPDASTFLNISNGSVFWIDKGRKKDKPVNDVQGVASLLSEAFQNPQVLSNFTRLAEATAQIVDVGRSLGYDLLSDESSGEGINAPAAAGGHALAQMRSAAEALPLPVPSPLSLIGCSAGMAAGMLGLLLKGPLNWVRCGLQTSRKKRKKCRKRHRRMAKKALTVSKAAFLLCQLGLMKGVQ